MSGERWDSIQEMLDELERGNTNERACQLGLRSQEYGSERHLRWFIDQMMRILAGGAYVDMILTWEEEEECWDIGQNPWSSNEDQDSL